MDDGFLLGESTPIRPSVAAGLMRYSPMMRTEEEKSDDT
jgi:hypothetical protein